MALEKRIVLPATLPDGTPVVQPCFPRDGTAFEKRAAEWPDALRAAIAQLTPDPATCCIVKAIMGAGRCWGANVNGDYFPEEHLLGTAPPWAGVPPLPPDWGAFGYPTFEQGHVFQHHQNKDPERACGQILKAVYHPTMHLVLLLERIVRAKATDICARIDRGEPVPVSMGCKVPWDECGICSHRSTRFTDYCQHLRLEMGRVYPDGRQVFAINYYPKFFDSSFVVVGADKTAVTLAKVAAARGTVPGTVRTLVGKAASEKAAELEKAVPPTHGDWTEECIRWRPRLVPACLARLPLSDDCLGALSEFGLPAALGSLTALGIRVQPRELAQLCQHTGQSVPVSLEGAPLPPGIRGLLAGLIPRASVFRPYARYRIQIRIERVRPDLPPPAETGAYHAVMIRCAQAFPELVRRAAAAGWLPLPDGERVPVKLADGRQVPVAAVGLPALAMGQPISVVARDCAVSFGPPAALHKLAALVGAERTPPGVWELALTAQIVAGRARAAAGGA